MPRDNDPADAGAPGVPADRCEGGRRLAGLPGEGRHFLLVFGPFGPFTLRLAENLRAAGARCSRILLNGGDVLDWGVRHAHPYFGSLHGFGHWLSARVCRDAVTDIIIYGDAHPYCVEAARVASGAGLRLHVLEQGYFRPFWITLERDGVNGNSKLPREPEFYRRAGALAPTPRDEWLPPLTPPAAWKLGLYHAALWFATPAFPRFRTPYPYSIPRQAFAHTRRYLSQRLSRRRHQDNLAKVLASPGPLFLGILQRPGDSQLRLHSPFGDTADFISQLVASFARHAPPSARLLFKAHPLDHGVESHDRAIAAAANAHQVSDRVFFADIGDLQAMFPGAAGTVTVNSTAGLSAIAWGLPTLVLGTAIYDMAGLTHQGGLDSFWTSPQKPDRDLYQAFRAVVINRTQVSGAYAIRQGVSRAVPEVARRLLAD